MTSQLVLQMAIVCVVHRKLRVVATAWWYVCARICRLDLLLCAPSIKSSLNRQRLLLALRSKSLAILLRRLLAVLDHGGRQKGIQVFLIHATQAMRGSVSAILVGRCASCHADLFAISTLHLVIRHSL